MSSTSLTIALDIPNLTSGITSRLATEPQTTNQAVEAQTSVPQAEDQPKGEDTLITSEIGKDVPNPVAVEGVEDDQEKAGEKGQDEEDDDDDDVVDEPKMATLAPLYASGRKENPVVVDVRLSMPRL